MKQKPLRAGRTHVRTTCTVFTLVALVVVPPAMAQVVALGQVARDAVSRGGLAREVPVRDVPAQDVSAQDQPARDGAAADVVAQFDTNILKERGLSPELANYFAAPTRFKVGTSQVTFGVNGDDRGAKKARFSDAGQLCFDAELMAALGLRMREGSEAKAKATATATAKADAAAPCAGASVVSGDTVVALDPGLNRVELTVPPQYLTEQVAAVEVAVATGLGAMLNYRYDTTDFRSKEAEGSRFSQLGTELGVNYESWIFRSRQITQSMSSGAAPTRITTNRLDAYAQKTFAEQAGVLQIGEISTRGSLFGGYPITGAQWSPEASLQAKDSSAGRAAVAFTGIAQTRARVEVRQNGALIYSQVVPPGPFSLDDLQVASSRNADLNVKVIEADGAQRDYVISAASLLVNTPATQPGWVVAAGQLRNFSSGTGNARTPLVTATKDIELANTPVNVGMLAAPGYVSAGVSTDLRLTLTTRLSYIGVASKDSANASAGMQNTLALVYSPNALLTLGGSMRRQSEGYSSLYQSRSTLAADLRIGQIKSTDSINGGFSLGRFGSAAVSFGRTKDFFNHTSTSAALAWSKAFAWGSANLRLERRNYALTAGNGDTGETVVYVGVNVPLGANGAVRTYAESRRGEQKVGAAYSATVGESSTVQLAQDTSSTPENSSRRIDAGFVPRYASVGLGYGTSGSGTSSTYAGVSGGVIATRAGVAFSPYPATDTFGLVNIGNMSGVRVDTPSGPVWTNFWGDAAISSLTPYHNAQLEVVGESLPANVDLVNGVSSLKVGRGAVANVQFDVVKVRRVMLSVRTKDGKPLRAGLPVLNQGDELVATSLPDGLVFVTDAGAGAGAGAGAENMPATLKVELAPGTFCALRFALPKDAVPALYENASATCEAP